ncbi:hypothetical protein [Streptomyces sp. NPDC057748]
MVRRAEWPGVPFLIGHAVPPVDNCDRGIHTSVRELLGASGPPV